MSKKFFAVLFFVELLVFPIFIYSQEQPISVTAGQISRNYEDNEVSAKAKYYGKEVIVTGMIFSIERDFLIGLHITMYSSGESYFPTPVVFVFSDGYSLMEFKKGDIV